MVTWNIKIPSKVLLKPVTAMGSPCAEQSRCNDFYRKLADIAVNINNHLVRIKELENDMRLLLQEFSYTDRTGRSLLPIVGKLFNSAFGLVHEEQLFSVHEQVKQNARRLLANSADLSE